MEIFTEKTEGGVEMECASIYIEGYKPCENVEELFDNVFGTTQKILKASGDHLCPVLIIFAKPPVDGLPILPIAKAKIPGGTGANLLVGKIMKDLCQKNGDFFVVSIRPANAIIKERAAGDESMSEEDIKKRLKEGFDDSVPVVMFDIAHGETNYISICKYDKESRVLEKMPIEIPSMSATGVFNEKTGEVKLHDTGVNVGNVPDGAVVDRRFSGIKN